MAGGYFEGEPGAPVEPGASVQAARVPAAEPVHKDTARPPLLLLPSERSGSHQHYYHLLLGNLVPLFALPRREREAYRWQFCDPGPLRSILSELGIECIPTEELVRRARWLRRWWQWRTSPLHAGRYQHLPTDRLLRLRGGKAVRLEGCDGLQPGDRERILTGAAAIQRELIGAENTDRPEPWVLVVDRAPPDEFYLTSALRRGAGTTRRSIPNLPAIASELAAHTRIPVRLERLEGTSLAHQVALFRGATVVVAQHGAALANLVWVPATTAVLEVVPVGTGNRTDYFDRLCQLLGLKRSAIAQDGPHAPVSPDAVIQTVLALLQTR